MKEIIQKMMVYMIIVSALRGLLTNKKYEEYFRLFSGLMMLLMLLLPLLAMFHSSDGWYQRLEENFLAMDISEIRGTLKTADGGFERVLMKEYSAALEKEVNVMAEEAGVSLQETKVSLEKENGEVRIAEISGETEKTETVIQTIRIGKERKKRQENDSGKAKKLKKKICSRFSLSGEQVHLWK